MLEQREKELQEKVDAMQKYLNIVEQQGMLPEAKNYLYLLKSAKRIGRRKVKKLLHYSKSPKISNVNEKICIAVVLVLFLQHKALSLPHKISFQILWQCVIK